MGKRMEVAVCSVSGRFFQGSVQKADEFGARALLLRGVPPRAVITRGAWGRLERQTWPQ